MIRTVCANAVSDGAMRGISTGFIFRMYSTSSYRLDAVEYQLYRRCI
jgi:hypothetical protein